MQGLRVRTGILHRPGCLDVPPFVPESIHVMVSQEEVDFSAALWVVRIVQRGLQSGRRGTDGKPPRLFQRWMLWSYNIVQSAKVTW